MEERAEQLLNASARCEIRDGAGSTSMEVVYRVGHSGPSKSSTIAPRGVKNLYRIAFKALIRPPLMNCALR